MREELRGGPGFRKRYRARRLPCCDPRQDGKGPPAHPPELAYPCCLPALGDLARLAPCEGSAAQFSPAGPRLWPLPAPAAPVSCPAEDSPSGLGRTLGKRVGGNPSGVRISYPPPPLTCDDALGSHSRGALHAIARVSFSVSVAPPAICLIPDIPVWWRAEMTHVVPGQRGRGRTCTEACTPLKRAPYRFRAGRDRQRPAGYPPTYRPHQELAGLAAEAAAVRHAITGG